MRSSFKLNLYQMDREVHITREDLMAEFREECQRTMNMSLEDRLRFGFTYEYKPILDDAEWRSFDSMEEYRRWCEDNLPKELGYGSSEGLDQEEIERHSVLMIRRELDRRRELRRKQNLP
jgi:hypothetical protein